MFRLILTKALLNLKSEASRNKLSYFWWVLEPFLYMLVFFIVFEKLLTRGMENYSSFLMTGLIPWIWFMKSVSNATNSIITNHHLLNQVKINPIIFPAIICFQNLIKQLPNFSLLFLFVILSGYEMNMNWIFFPIVFVLQFNLIFIASSICALSVIYIRDLTQLIPMLLTFLMFISGIFYGYEQIPEKYQSIFLSNPLAFLIQTYRNIFLGINDIDLNYLLILFFISILIIVFIFKIFNIIGMKVTKKLSE